MKICIFIQPEFDDSYCLGFVITSVKGTCDEHCTKIKELYDEFQKTEPDSDGDFIKFLDKHEYRMVNCDYETVVIET